MYLGSVGNARATPVDALGFGARSKAMGGAVAADARDYSANYYNRSSLALFERLELAFGYTHAGFELSFNERPAQLEPVRAWMLGVVAPGKVAGVPVAFGLALQLPRGHLSQGRTIRETDPYWVLYEDRLQIFYTSVNLAVRPLPWLSVAVGTASLATTDGGFDVRGTTVVPQFERSKYESELDHQVDARLESVRYPQASLTLVPNAESRLALSYRDEAKIETQVSAHLDTVLDGTILEIPLRYDVDVRSVKLFIPRQLDLAGAWTPGAWSLEFDLTWVDWSSYESPISTTTTRIDAQPPEGVTVDLPASALPPDGAPARFGDRWVPRVGVENRLKLSERVRLPVRAGYVYEKSPVPPQVGRTNFLDADRHVVSAGIGLLFSGLEPVLAGAQHVDIGVQLGMLEPRKVDKSHANAKPDEISLKGTFWTLNADLSLEF